MLVYFVYCVYVFPVCMCIIGVVLFWHSEGIIIIIAINVRTVCVCACAVVTVYVKCYVWIH